MKYIAHRGASLQAPENTMASIKRALSFNVDLIEIDVHLSKDKIPILIHDSSLERTAGAKLFVHDLILKELRTFDVGSWFSSEFKNETIPTLQEVLSLGRFMIELKAQEGLEKELVEAVLKVFSGDHLIGSFSPIILKEIKKRQPSFPLISIAEQIDMIGPQRIVALDEKLITQDLIKKLHKEEREVFAWTVDDPERAKILINQGIDGLITNDPGKINAKNCE